MNTRFEIVNDYINKDINLPHRATKYSAGYDIEAAEDIVVPSIFNTLRKLEVDRESVNTSGLSYIYKPIGYYTSMRDAREEPFSTQEIKRFVKELKLTTLIPTGLKVSLKDDEYLSIHSRSSIGVNCLLMLANQTGIIDADYYNNEDNEGHIFIPMINLSPYDIKIKKGERIAQGIISKYNTVDEDTSNNIRTGGFGSTDK